MMKNSTAFSLMIEKKHKFNKAGYRDRLFFFLNRIIVSAF